MFSAVLKAIEDWEGFTDVDSIVMGLVQLGVVAKISRWATYPDPIAEHSTRSTNAWVMGRSPGWITETRWLARGADPAFDTGHRATVNAEASMRALPLTSNQRPGGRPRASRAPRNAFRDWLVDCGMTPQAIAKTLKISVSSVYNSANGYFIPGRKLAVAIEQLTKGKVSVESWETSKPRKR